MVHKSVLRCLVVLGLLLSNASRVQAQPKQLPLDDSKQSFGAANSPGVAVQRDREHVFLEIQDPSLNTVSIPRLAAPLQAIRWQRHEGASVIKFKPEPDRWTISWETRPPNADTLVIQLAGRPLLMEECLPIRAASDSSLMLPAHLGVTRGEKLRYEPQTFKNTIGYWTVAGDSVHWAVQIDLPGRYNVAILQGCGKDQGGSQVRLQIARQGGRQETMVEQFEVIETGHFQNFQWRHLGEVQLDTGRHNVMLNPVSIANKAVMDVRAIHLIRIPQ